MRAYVLIVILAILAGFSAAIPIGGIVSCVNITTSGSYFLLTNLSGSPNPNVAIAGSASCIRIISSNVVLDCMGFSITNQTNLSVPSGAVVVDNLPPSAPLTNITVKNCAISGFDVGIAASVVGSSLIQNNTVWDGTLYGIGYGTSSLDSQFIGNTVHDISRAPGFPAPLAPYQGFFLSAGVNGTFVNNSAYGNLGDGFHLESGSDYNRFTGNAAFGNGGYGFGINSSSFNTLEGNTAYNNSRGFYLYSSSGSNLTNNTAFSNAGPGFFDGGFYLESSSNNSMANNTAHDNAVGIFLTGSDGNAVRDSEIFNNVGGFRLQDASDGNTVENNAIYNNSDAGAYLLFSSNNTFASNEVYGCPNTGVTVAFESGDVFAGNDLHDNGLAWNLLVQFVSYSVFSGNTLHGNSVSGLMVFQSFLNNFSSNEIYGNGADGMTLSEANNNLFLQNSIHDNPGHGINGLSSSFNNLTGNSVFENGRDGILFADSFSVFSHNRIADNAIHDNGWNGIELVKTDNNTLENNTVFGNGFNGIALNPGVSLVVPSLAARAAPFRASLAPGPIPPTPSISGSDNNSLLANDVYGNSRNGILLNASSRNILLGNDAYGNAQNGISLIPAVVSPIIFTAPEPSAFLSGAQLFVPPPPGPSPSVSKASDKNLLVGNTAYENSRNGVYLNTSSNNSLLGNTAYSNGNDGFLLHDENISVSGGGGSICGNFICESGETISCPIDCGPPASHNNLSGNIAFGNDLHGFELDSSDNDRLLGNLAHDNADSGYRINNSPNTTFFNNTAYGNAFGFYETGNPNESATTINRSWFYGNGWEITEIGPVLILLNGNPGFQIINSKLGNSSVNISLNDELLGGGYQLNDTIAPAPPLLHLVSFHDKYLKVNFTGESEIDALSYIWSDTEATGFQEALIRAYTWNGTNWTLTPSQSTDALSNTLSTFALANITDDDIYGLLVPPAPDEDTPQDSLSISFASQCSGNTVTVSSNGEPVTAARVVIDSSDVYYTGADGKAVFPGCGGSVTIEATKSGYSPADASASPVACSECAPPPQNATNVTPPQPPQPSYECMNDSQCMAADYCDIQQNQTGGKCRPAAGDCGQVRDHRFVPYGYQCGSEPGCPSCPSGQSCVDHVCVIYDLTGPETTFINGTAAVHATNSTAPCALCDLVIADPSGKTFTGKSDVAGGFAFPTPLKGIYNVTLLVDGKPYKSVLINALPQSQPPEPAKPTENAPAEQFPWWLLILVAILILFFIYTRRRKEKRVK
ncbi:MAG TPA: right-handed parallel beta-helix repeat-containing protein [Candidatus Bilamarchaeum sp.]|nr:right-handed parallel beta-helix repeat-containing protein [Candidatus Bilamarchaeum sp.]